MLEAAVVVEYSWHCSSLCAYDYLYPLQWNLPIFKGEGCPD